MTDALTTQARESWETYWRGIKQSGKYGAGGAAHPGFGVFWTDALGAFLADRPDARIVDIGSGSGALLDHLSAIPGATLANASCVDVSPSAIDSVKARFPGVTGVVADAASIPLDDGGYDLVLSQFGVEYAGTAGVEEAIRLLAPGGKSIFLMHFKDGALYRECDTTITALRRLLDSGFIPRAREYFDAGFRAVRGGDRDSYEEAARQLNPAIKELEAIIAEHGEQVADGTIAYLYSNVQEIHGRIANYEPDQVLEWLDRLEEEVRGHLERMQAMHASALDEPAFKVIHDRLLAMDLRIDQAEALYFGEGPLPFAWVLVTSRAVAKESREEHAEWIRQTVDAAVTEIMAKGLVEDGMVEARAGWVLSRRYVIGEVREARDHESLYWFITGDVPTDIIAAGVAATPRDAARQFSMKWQLFASQLQDPAAREKLGFSGDHDWDARSAAIVAQAEALYDIVDNDALWEPAPT